MEKTQIEIERKYIIEKPSADEMKKLPEYTESTIVQIYLNSEAGVTHRVRSRTYGSKTVYTETVKRRIDRMSSEETEREISKEDFDILAENIRKGSHPVNKTRHTFLYKGQIFEIDIYPKWKNTAVMETELKDRKEEPEIPVFIKVVEEVTGNRAYSNASMSLAFPNEK